MTTEGSDDRARVASLLPGDPAHVARFLKDISPTVWAACCLLTADDAEASEAFLAVMVELRADGFARFRDYVGGTVETFVALLVRDILGQRALQLLRTDHTKGWRAFERLFEADLHRLIRRRLPGSAYESMREEAYQEVCLALIDGDYRRLKAYSGTGSFGGFVLRTVDRILIDFLRGVVSRRRLPAAIARLSVLDQEVFKLVSWRHLPERPDVLAPYLESRLDGAPSLADIAAALARVRASSASDGGHHARMHTVRDHLVSAVPSPEDHLVQAEQDELLTAALDVLTRAMGTLSDSERLYLTVMLGGAQSLPSREIARVMQRPVHEVYKLKQRVLKRLRDLISDEAAVKNWRASI
jgi:RNA polymerase primary sigma factor